MHEALSSGHVSSHRQVLQYYDLEHVSKWAWLGWEALFFAGFVVAAWAALSLVRHQRR